MKKIVIYPMGFGSVFLFIVIGVFMLAAFPIIAIGVFVIKTPDLSLWHAILGFGLTVTGVYFIYQFFFNSKVVFDNGRLIFNSGGANKKQYPIINVNCKELIDFEWTHIISFKKNNGTKVVFGCVKFSRKQLVHILYEIQVRGGLQGIDIDKKLNIKKQPNK